MMKKMFFAAALLAGMLNVSAKVEVASLSTVLADLARQVGGDRVEIVEIVKPGVDPHAFEPSPGDIKKVSQAQVVLASGLGFESSSGVPGRDSLGTCKYPDNAAFP